MTDQHEPPLPDDQGHVHEHDHEHDHGHDHAGHALNVSEQPLDPASQSLSDALKASFGVLKVIMLVVVILFLLSGVFSVGTNERVVVWRLGRLHDVAEPGLHFAAPYPIDEKFRVQTSPQRLQINTFWLNLNDADKLKALNELDPRGQRLDPATDGALLTGDRGIVHLQFTALYEIRQPDLFVQNVAGGAQLLQSVLENAAIAAAAGSTTDELLKGKGEVGSRIRKRAQESLDAIQSGIVLTDVTADKLHYPLQTKEAFVSVSTAENTKRDAIQEALSERTKKLNGAAGPAWMKLYDQIRRLDQVQDGPQREAVLKEIGSLLEEAQGEAGGKIKLALSRKQEIKNQAEGERSDFNAVFEGAQYRQHPELVKDQLRQKVVADLLAQAGVTKWFLPAGDKQITIWLNKDPVQAKQAEIEAMKKKTGYKGQ